MLARALPYPTGSGGQGFVNRGRFVGTNFGDTKSAVVDWSRFEEFVLPFRGMVAFVQCHLGRPLVPATVSARNLSPPSLTLFPPLHLYHGTHLRFP